MWSPTHVQVTVQRAKNLLAKGRGGTNDAFVLIQMGKEKFQTTVKEKCTNPEWYEECDLLFLGKESMVHLMVFHRNLLGLDEFLGQVSIPLDQFSSYDRTVNKWYQLQSKKDKKTEKYRGEIEVKVSFVVHSADTHSLNDFSIEKKKRKNSFKGLATTVGHKIQKLPSRTFSLRQQDFSSHNRLTKVFEKRHSIAHDGQQRRNVDEPDFDQDGLDDNEDKHMPLKSVKKLGPLYSSTLSLPQSAMITSSIRELDSMEDLNDMNDSFASDHSNSPDFNQGVTTKSSKKDDTIGNLDIKQEKHGEWTKRISSRMKDLTRSEMNLTDIIEDENSNSREKKSAMQTLRNTLRRHTLQLNDSSEFASLKLALNSKRNSFDKENKKCNSTKDNPTVLPGDIPHEVFEEYSKRDHQDLVILAIKQQAEMERQRDKITDLENYLDNLLVRVMETTPKILQTPYKSPNLAFSR